MLTLSVALATVGGLAIGYYGVDFFARPIELKLLRRAHHQVELWRVGHELEGQRRRCLQAQRQLRQLGRERHRQHSRSQEGELQQDHAVTPPPTVNTRSTPVNAAAARTRSLRSPGCFVVDE